MKIRNVFCSLVVAFAVVSVSQAATATDLDVVHTAYEAYEGAAKALERSIDVGVSLEIENYCTLRQFFDLSTLAGLSRRNLSEAGIWLLFQI